MRFQIYKSCFGYIQYAISHQIYPIFYLTTWCPGLFVLNPPTKSNYSRTKWSWVSDLPPEHCWLTRAYTIGEKQLFLTKKLTLCTFVGFPCLYFVWFGLAQVLGMVTTTMSTPLPAPPHMILVLQFQELCVHTNITNSFHITIFVYFTCFSIWNWILFCKLFRFRLCSSFRVFFLFFHGRMGIIAELGISWDIWKSPEKTGYGQGYPWEKQE